MDQAINALAQSLVTSFSPHNGDQLLFDGMPYTVQNADRPWSISNPDPDTLRFELRSGDVWEHDASNRERSGISGGFFAAGKDVAVTYDFMVEPGAPNTSDWVVMGQFHAADGFSSPPFAVELVGERLAITLRYKLPGEQVYTWRAFLDDEPIVRGKYYHLHAEFDVEAKSEKFRQRQGLAGRRANRRLLGISRLRGWLLLEGRRVSCSVTGNHRRQLSRYVDRRGPRRRNLTALSTPTR